MKALFVVRKVSEIRTDLEHPLTCIDLMWSDPDDVDAWAVSPRGAGWLFGRQVTAEVCVGMFPVLNQISD